MKIIKSENNASDREKGINVLFLWFDQIFNDSGLVEGNNGQGYQIEKKN